MAPPSCPLIPIANISGETAAYARKLGKSREELTFLFIYMKLPSPKKKNTLSVIRAGEYERFAHKILLP